MAEQYTIRVGDTLEGISVQHYGNPNLWKKIFNANVQRLQTPESLTPGERITIPD